MDRKTLNIEYDATFFMIDISHCNIPIKCAAPITKKEAARFLWRQFKTFAPFEISHHPVWRN